MPAIELAGIVVASRHRAVHAQRVQQQEAGHMLPGDNCPPCLTSTHNHGADSTTGFVRELGVVV